MRYLILAVGALTATHYATYQWGWQLGQARSVALHAGEVVATAPASRAAGGTHRSSVSGNDSGASAAAVRGGFAALAPESALAPGEDASTAEPDVATRVDRLWSRSMHEIKDPWERLLREAKTRPEVLAELIGRYQTSNDPKEQRNLAAILAGTGSSEVETAALGLASRNDQVEKVSGLQLIQALQSGSDEVHALIRDTLRNDPNPQVLAAALAALPHPSGAADEVSATAAELRGLTANSDPEIRSQSLVRLAEWDPAHVEDDIVKALSDPDPAVRVAATAAAGTVGLRSQTIRDRLTEFANNPGGSSELQEVSTQVLQRWQQRADDSGMHNGAAAGLW